MNCVVWWLSSLNNFMTEIARLLALAGLNFDELLMEGAKDRYNQLFQNVPDEIKDNASLEVQWAMQNLKREDRIVWYLRYARIAMLDRVKSDDAAFVQFREKTLRELAIKSKVSPKWDDECRSSASGHSSCVHRGIHERQPELSLCTRATGLSATGVMSLGAGCACG